MVILPAAHSTTFAKSIKLRHGRIRFRSLHFNETTRYSPQTNYLQKIDRHYHEKCKCGLKSAATIEMMAQTLFDSQDKEGGKALLTEKGEKKWCLDTCIHWMGNLMGKNSFKGKEMEDEAVKVLKKEIWKYKIVKADEEADVSSGVDLFMMQNDEIIAGIQVKTRFILIT